MSTISSFKSIENKHDVYRGKDCMKTVFESLKNTQRRELILKRRKTNGKQKPYQNAKICYICKEKYCKIKKNCH